VLVFEPLPALKPGANADYYVYVKAQRAGEVRFKVELTADQLKTGGPVREEESTTIYGGKAPMPPAAPQNRPKNKH
jgi:hypothetical protein